MLDKPTQQKIEQYFRQGILKSNMSRIENIMSRAMDHKTGKLYHGEEGEQLIQRQLDKAQYYERNK